MNSEVFREKGKKMIDYMCDYMKNVENFEVTPNIKPGFLRPLLPDQAPEKPEEYEVILFF